MINLLKLITALFVMLASGEAMAASGFTWLGGISHSLHIGQHVIMLVLICLFLALVGILYRASLSKVSNTVIPDNKISLRSIVELYGEFIYGQCKAVLGDDQAGKYFGFIAITFIVILLSNLVGLIPGFLPPTEHLSTTLALGAFSFVYYNIKGCKEQGTLNYIKHFAGPLWYLAFLIFPIEIISNCIRPLSLALRLRSNMMGDHMVLSIFSGLAPYVVPIIFMILGILVSLIQAYVFTILSMVYISLATHHDHDEDHH